LVVVVAAFAVAFIVSALGQAAFSVIFPEFSARIVGSTDIATYVLLVLLALAFSLFGFLVPRWLKGPMLLLWLLLPIAAVYLLAIVGQPYAYGCNPLNTTYVVSCWMVISPFVVGAAAAVVGFVFYWPKARVSANAV
jgi:hypothetical protein